MSLIFCTSAVEFTPFWSITISSILSSSITLFLKHDLFILLISILVVSGYCVILISESINIDIFVK